MSPKNDRLIILDTTLRDGEQTPGVNLNLNEKLEIARLLETLGVDVIEAGFPAASAGGFEAVRAVSQTVSCGVAALCRCLESDIRTGWDAVKYAEKPRLHVFIATSELHMAHKLKMTPEQVLTRVADCVRLAKSLCEDVEFSCEDASRSDPRFLCRVLETAIDAGASTVNIADTVGYSLPDEFAELIRGLIRDVPNIGKAVFSVHCHNDLGLAVANTLSAIGAGARQIETTVNGLGERAGNCSMEEAVMAVDVRAARFPVSHGVDTTKIYHTSQRVSRLTGVPVSVTKAIVGDNAFAHESGIHQHGMLSNPLTYEIMTPQSVGKTESTMVLGKLSGRHAFSDRLESMGFSLTREDLDEAFARFKELADRKKSVSDEDLLALVDSLDSVPEFYRLENFEVRCGNKEPATAGVTLVYGDRPMTGTATGAGPVEAAYNAAGEIMGNRWPLSSYAVRAVTEGRDALGEATVRVWHGGELHVGHGLSTDVVEASIAAYINAVNRATAKLARQCRSLPEPDGS